MAVNVTWFEALLSSGVLCQADSWEGGKKHRQGVMWLNLQIFTETILNHSFFNSYSAPLQSTICTLTVSATFLSLPTVQSSNLTGVNLAAHNMLNFSLNCLNVVFLTMSAVAFHYLYMTETHLTASPPCSRNSCWHTPACQMCTGAVGEKTKSHANKLTRKHESKIWSTGRPATID